MAGAAMTNIVRVEKFGEVIYNGLIKSSDIVNNGMVGSIDSNGDIVEASKTQAATVQPMGIIVFTDEHGSATNRTGNGVLRASIAMWAVIGNLTTTLVPSLAAGDPIYLGPIPTATVSNYTATPSTTANDLKSVLGFALSATQIYVRVTPTQFIYQTSTTSTAVFV